ncbi:hypothetical protein Enr13x_23890 [Stieleria neptunia]|uniref:Uncharacterized protein n=1 Tax=Stieleria neptunia TaxID=2527979 RepID=A0A518HNZ1_9BACT|nr:hypothetical protein Enr13x_23890 [Stieleria neptunia]
MKRRLIDPGLPPWPALYFDDETHRAFVTARLVDWRAVERGHATTKVLVAMMCVTVGYWAWIQVPPYEDVIVRLFLVFVLAAIVMAVLAPAMRVCCPMFLARTLFARRLSLLFTPEAIGYRSWLFDNGVRITRSFNGRSVQASFTMRADVEAQDVAALRHQDREKSRLHLNQARLLEVVVRGTASRLRNIGDSVNTRLRTLPVATLDARQGEKITVVLNAAVELTQGTVKPIDLSRSGFGLDLDGPTDAEV